MLDKAIYIASIAHLGQTDKGGSPYILHPLRVMFKAHSEDAKIVAVLHDVIEDSFLSISDLENAGFSKNIIDTVIAITRLTNETYMEFISRVKKNGLARIVKRADIEDNLDLMRIPNPTEEDYSRNKRYKKALDLLNE